MKVIFLDIDGVIIPYGPWRMDKLHPTCVEHLRRIMEATGAHLVISSSWRIAKYAQLVGLFSAVGIAVLDRTPSGLALPLGVFGAFTVAGERPREIRAWLAAHPDVTAFIVLDDDLKMRDLPLVGTASYEGLTGPQAQRAIDLS